MEMQEMEITVEADGNTIIHVKGVKGSDCLTITKALEESLGTVVERTHTSELYEQPDYILAREAISAKNGDDDQA